MRLTGLLALACLCTGTAAFAQVEERWDLPLDGRDWKLVAENRAGRLTERIYVIPGESEYFWSERIIIGHQRMAFSPDDYLTGFVEYLNETCRPFKMKPLQQNDTAVFLQWEGDCRITGEQFEYRRVQVAADGVHFLAYASKLKNLSEAKREAWLRMLGAANLKPR